MEGQTITKKIWKGATLLTFSGVKGTVSIATILLLPVANITALEHSLLLLYGSGCDLAELLNRDFSPT